MSCVQIWKYMEYEKLYSFLTTSEKAEILFNYCLLVENARQATLQFIQKPYLEAFLQQTLALFKKLNLDLYIVYLDIGRVIIFNPSVNITTQEMKDMFEPVDDDVKIGKVLGMGCVGDVRQITGQDVSYGIDMIFYYKGIGVRPYNEVCSELRVEYAREKFRIFNKVAKKIGVVLVCELLKVQVKQMKQDIVLTITEDNLGSLESKEDTIKVQTPMIKQTLFTPSFTPTNRLETTKPITSRLETTKPINKAKSFR